ncbi:MAG: PP2C family protein-serine/threonine phosphatase [Thermodesulfobacteriota bacterium]
MTIVESAGLTDVGNKRKNNEDSFLMDNDLLLYIVADGMGGHQAGEVASHLVVTTLRDYMKDPSGKEDIEQLIAFDDSLTDASNKLLAAIQLANRAVHDISKSKKEFQGMGSTVAVVYIKNQTLIAANVGDSPIYLVHQNEIELISVPHTVMAEHAALDPEGKRTLGAAFKHMLTRGMGIESCVKADISEFQLFDDDVLIICSDGLSDKVTPDEIRSTVRTHQPEKACRVLKDLAIDRGGEDNITVVIVKIKNVETHRQGAVQFFLKIQKALKKTFFTSNQI